VATGIHPFALETFFRLTAKEMQPEVEAGNGEFADLSTAYLAREQLYHVRGYTAFVDAQTLCRIWPSELDAYRVSIISGDENDPIINIFKKADADDSELIDVVMRNVGDTHFTLLPHFEDGRDTDYAGLMSCGYLIQEPCVIAEGQSIEATLGRYIREGEEDSRPFYRRLLQCKLVKSATTR
jgi:hypothetical protein